MNLNNHEDMIEEFQRMAMTGDGESALQLAEIYDYGIGVPQDSKEAAKWYELAVKNGSDACISRLAKLYDQDDTMPDGKSKAFALYMSAAKGGDSRAKIRIGEMLLNGLGVSKDKQKALQWFMFAAQDGVPEAYYKIGCLIHEEGETDEAEAIRWLDKASQKGHVSAANKLRAIKAKHIAKKYMENIHGGALH